MHAAPQIQSPKHIELEDNSSTICVTCSNLQCRLLRLCLSVGQKWSSFAAHLCRVAWSHARRQCPIHPLSATPPQSATHLLSAIRRGPSPLQQLHHQQLSANAAAAAAAIQQACCQPAPPAAQWRLAGTAFNDAGWALAWCSLNKRILECCNCSERLTPGSDLGYSLEDIKFSSL